MNLDQQKAGEKSGKRKQKHGKKKEQKGAKTDKALVAKELVDATIASADTAMEAGIAVAATEVTAAARQIEQSAAAATPTELAAPADATPTSPVPGEPTVGEPTPGEPAPRVASFRERMASVAPRADTAPRIPPAPATIARVPSPAATPVAGMQAIANAYRDYTRKSLQDAQSLAEKLSAARSLDKAVEAQAEFAQKACENFAADSRKIRELHRELFWQTFRLPNWPLGRMR